MHLRRVVLPSIILLGMLSACGSEPPASIEFVSVTPPQPRIGEIATVNFRVLDSRGGLQPGAAVNFSLQAESGGVTLNPPTALTTKGTGIASTQVTSSSRVASVVVVAESGGKTATSPPITFAGSLPSARQFTFQCGEIAGPGSGGLHNLLAFDETRHLIQGVSAPCSAHVADRNGDSIPGALVSFITEAGTISPTGLTSEQGFARVEYKVTLPLPRETTPVKFTFDPNPNDANTSLTGELAAPLWMHPFEWRPKPFTTFTPTNPPDEPRRNDPVRPGRENNPRDNLVTMIAVTTGEEAFDDVNNNGKFDENEPFDDLTEPFVDTNDDGTWDAEERWIDVNSNGTWDGKNGKHDASTLIWVQERILWGGLPHERDLSGAGVVDRIFVQIFPTAAIALAHTGASASRTDVQFLISDPWYNTYVQNGDGDGCGLGKVETADKPLVKAIPSTFGALGRRLTYPSVESVTFQLGDAHDPNATPPEPAFPVAQPFSVPISCKITGSPSGPSIEIVATSLRGSVL